MFWQKNSRYIGPSTKGVPNIAEIFGRKTFGDIAPPVYNGINYLVIKTEEIKKVFLTQKLNFWFEKQFRKSGLSSWKINAGFVKVTFFLVHPNSFVAIIFCMCRNSVESKDK
jgi:hypothetical protein